MHKELKIDLAPPYISFERQATDATGLKTNPSATPTVSIYEESGADATYDNSMIDGSPFTCAIINAKVGNYGVLVAKSLFTVGKIYRVLFEWIVDGVATAWEENFLAVNASQSKADVSTLATEANATTNKTAVIAEVDANEVKIDLLTSMIQYLNGEADYSIAAAPVPARNVLVGMIDYVDMAISATQVLHVEYYYNSAKKVVSKRYTVV